MSIEWRYEGYPAWAQDGILRRQILKITEGTVRVRFDRRPEYPLQDPAPGAQAVLKNRPLSVPVGWSFLGDVPDDLQRYVRGRYWHRIPTALYAQFLDEVGLGELARRYRVLAGV